MKRDNSPYMTTAKFASVCQETGKSIRKGDDILYYPRTKAVFCASSKEVQGFRETEMDRVMSGLDF